jgi:Fe-Mn family superoxide dismutase
MLGAIIGDIVGSRFEFGEAPKPGFEFYTDDCSFTDDTVCTIAIADAIMNNFGSFDAFKEEFQKKGTTLFGSGWVWLSADQNGNLIITQETNAANPIQKGITPLLTFDVWEHAYYLDYQNRRADHLAALWQIVDWDIIEQRYRRHHDAITSK